jgi:hypothetical protein
LGALGGVGTECVRKRYSDILTLRYWGKRRYWILVVRILVGGEEEIFRYFDIMILGKETLLDIGYWDIGGGEERAEDVQFDLTESPFGDFIVSGRI